MAAAFLTVSCGRSSETADLVIINGKILTINEDEPYVEAVAISKGIIVRAGKNNEIKKTISRNKTEVIDAKGRLVIPGFNDAHAHFGPLDPDYIELRYTTDPKIITQKVKERIASSQPGEMIRGGHWEHEMFTTRQWPSKALIDSVSPSNPVILSRADGHSVLVNSYVLRESGINKDTPDPFGGEIQRDPLTGEPTGILKENAMGLIKRTGRNINRTQEEIAQREWNGYLLALKEAREYGVTSIQIPGSADFEMYGKLLNEGLLTSRIDIGRSLTGDAEKLRTYLEESAKFSRDSNWIRFGYLKAFIDGTIGSGTALMFEPFSDNPETSGLAVMPYDEFENMVVTADKMGFQIGVHAIGDKGNNWVLNAYEKAQVLNGKRESRHRSEHAQTLAEKDIPRFAELGVIPSMQPTHCISDKKFCEKRIGAIRSAGAYAWRSLLNTGAILAFGTDYQVEPLNPMEGLYAAVTRKERSGEEGEGWFPEQKLTMEEAIKYYTLGSAYAQFMEDRKGIIKEGYLADIVIVNQDLLTIPETEIMKTKVDYTIVDGKVVFARN